jgi:hypothetical protein
VLCREGDPLDSHERVARDLHLAVIGALFMASSYEGSNSNDGWALTTRYMFAYPLLVGGAVGVGAGGPGWLRSRRAAREFNLARPPAAQIPPGIYAR